jgi:hypothetical protein
MVTGVASHLCKLDAFEAAPAAVLAVPLQQMPPLLLLLLLLLYRICD